MKSERWSPRGAAIHADLRWLAVSALLIAVVAALGAIVAGRVPLFDSQVLGAFRAARESPAWPLLTAVNLVGYPVIWDVAVVILATVMAFRSWCHLAGNSCRDVRRAGSAAAAHLKLGVDRLRPPDVLIVALVTDASYPSGHVARVAATAGSALLLAWPMLRRRGRPAMAVGIGAAVAVVALMAAARLAAGEHWPTDVLGACLLGGAVVAAMAAFVSPTGTTAR